MDESNEFAPITTQEEFDAAVEARMQQERDTLNQQNAQTQAELLRVRVAYESGLPYALADRLNGETEEDLRNDAANLLKYVQPKKTKAPPLAETSDPVATDPRDAALKKLAADLRKE